MVTELTSTDRMTVHTQKRLHPITRRQENISDKVFQEENQRNQETKRNHGGRVSNTLSNTSCVIK